MKISEATKKEQVLATDSIPVGAANSNQAYRIEMSQVNKFVHNNSASTTCDYVEALDASGNPIKINKSNLAMIVSEQIGNSSGMKGNINKFNSFPSGVTSLSSTSIPIGYYNVSANNLELTDIPEGYKGWFLFENRGNTPTSDRIQRITLQNNGHLYQRVLWNTQILKDWVRIDNFGANTEAELAAVVAGQEPILSINRRSRKQFTNLNTLKSAVADQNLEKYGLQVGDYYTVSGRTYVIAGLNVMRGSSTPYRVNQNHVGLIVIPHTTQAWNASGNTSTGADGRGAGYANSDLHYYLKNTLLPSVQSDLGSGNLIAHSKLLSTAVNTAGYNKMGSPSGCSSSWAWESNCYISALSEVQVYGATVWSSSGYDTGEACRQLDVFRIFNHTEIFGGEYPWLRDVVSGSYAAYAHDNGGADRSPASNARYVAALILFH